MLTCKTIPVYNDILMREVLLVTNNNGEVIVMWYSMIDSSQIKYLPKSSGW